MIWQCLVAVLRGDSKVSGTVLLEQLDESSPTTITYDIKGNDPNAKRGMHVHQFGDNTNGCTSAGPHFNPYSKTHGAPEDAERHVGDLGNFSTDAEGNGKGTITDSHVKLIGPQSVVGVSRTLESAPTSSQGASSSDFRPIRVANYLRPRRNRRSRQGRQRGVKEDRQCRSPSRLR